MSGRWVCVVMVAVLFAAACSPGGVVEVVAAPDATATAIPTTAPAVVPTATLVPPTPVEIGASRPLVPSEPAEVPATPTAEPVGEPTAIATEAPAPATTPTAAPTAQATVEPTPTPTDPTSQEVLATNGGEVYTVTCARCHGDNGFGSALHVGLLGAGSNYSNAAMIDELTNGHPFTFGFADKLSSEEIAAVVAYVRATFR